jgi:hypothetical protein
MTLWKDEIEYIKNKLDQGESLQSIGEGYGVSRQRMYQVCTKFGVQTMERKKANFLTDMPPEYYWLNKMLCLKGVPKLDRWEMLKSTTLPMVCPMLGKPLNYNGTGREGYTREDFSPSLDRVDSSKGYTKDNIQVISWRANRIKNDSTPEELMMIAKYMQQLTEK